MTTVEFITTENIKKINIENFILKDKDFIFTWTTGKKTSIDFDNSKKGSVSKIVKNIEKKLSQQIKEKDKLDPAIRDIEDQLVRRREEIFTLNKIKVSNADSYPELQSKFLEDVSKLREHFEKSDDPYKEWQQDVKEKYNNLYEITIKYYPNTWLLMQFILSVKTILNINNNKLPFIGIILAFPSTLKTTFIKFFRKYINTFYSDSFTPNSLISHNSALTEEQLKEIDMIPKMKSKLVLTPELAPLFTSKDDDLQKILGIIIRLVDGDGLESDSGAHGHRGYPPTLFSWVGAVVEIPPKVWKILSHLGFKIYFLRPDFLEKSEAELVKIALDNKILKKSRN